MTYQVNERFAGNTLDAALWEIATYPKGYRNHEEQDYRPAQVRVHGGKLRITAVRDAVGQWHSGEVHSRWDYRYGEFEARLALSATGPGVWPAAWLMGTTDVWPAGGEIDIVESTNSVPTVYGTIHGDGTGGHWQIQAQCSGIDVTRYHTYKIVKAPGVVSWWVDGVKRGEWTPAQAPAGAVWPYETHRSFALLNLAIGGDWPGPSSAATPGEVVMSVDYFTVRNGT